MQAKTKKQVIRARLRCPCCKGRVIDSNPRTNTRLYDMEIAKEFFVVDYLVKCSQCKREIGIEKIGSR